MPEARLIDANAFTAQYGDYYAEEGTESGFIGTVGCLISKQPTIEAEQVHHGQWIFGSSKTSCWMTCSICCKSQSGQTATFSYCPNCGARMDADHIADASKKVGGVDNG